MTEKLQFRQGSYNVKSQALANQSYHEVYDNKEYFEATQNDFIIVVPSDYDHDKQIDKFIKQALSNAYEYDVNFNSLNFSQASSKLMPGKIYRCTFYKIDKPVSNEKCLSFLHSQKAMLVGGQGLALICQLKPNKFPDDRFVISLDHKESLWQSPQGRYMVPCFSVEQMHDPDNFYILRPFDELVPGNHYLLCVTAE